MRLTFNVLWFEDTTDFLAPIIQRLNEHLDEQGFYLSNHPIEKNGEKLINIIQKINEKKLDVDLISMDYKLSGGDKGDELINTIREHKLLTDIIFYSQDKKFINETREKLEGVYFADRKSLPNKIIAVTDHILKKTLDLSNFRGLVMAETSELDELIGQIIEAFFVNNFLKEPLEEKKKIKKRISEKINACQKNLNKIKIDDVNGNIRELLSNLEASVKTRTLQSLITEFTNNPPERSFNGIEYRDIAKKIPPFRHEDMNSLHKVRNQLAHLKETTDKNGKKILKSTRKGQENFEFDEKKASEIRKNLKKYYELLNIIYETISMKIWN